MEDDAVKNAPSPVDAPEKQAEKPRGSNTRLRARRAQTIDMSRVTKRELEFGRLLFPDKGETRLPETRGECDGGPRPCPLVACKYNLYLDVNADTGAIKINFPDLEVWEMKESCALDEADQGGMTLEDVGELLNVTRERIRQMEEKMLPKLEKTPAGRRLKEYLDETSKKVRLRVIQPQEEDDVDAG